MFLGELLIEELKAGLNVCSGSGRHGKISNIIWKTGYASKLGPELIIVWDDCTESIIWFSWEQKDPQITIDDGLECNW